MYSPGEPTQHLEHIKQMMDRSSRFVSLSGWSGISAGICALISAWVAHDKMRAYRIVGNEMEAISYKSSGNADTLLNRELFILGFITFIVAFSFAILFNYLRSRKTGVPIWGFVARKVVINVAIPMIAGALLVWRLMDFGLNGLIIPVCLIFYGLALINASKFTFPEVRYLGYLQLLLGLLNLWTVQYGLYYWVTGFGILHIVYGILMWNKYERNENVSAA